MTDAGPASGTLPDTQVRAMFDRIARVYDRMNSVMTAGMHHRWRERAADLARVGPGDTALDVAAGTGDLAVELDRRGVGVTGLDFSAGMLEIAREKAPGIRFEQGDALALPYADGEFDAATVGFGARNFSDLRAGLAEMARVTRPGGRVVVLEITTPQRPPLSLFFRLWFDRVVPALGRLAGDSDAYSYLPSSVRRFPGPVGLAEEMAAVGLVDVRWVLTAGGIIAIHAGTRVGMTNRAHPATPGASATATNRAHPATPAGAQLGTVLEAGGPRLAGLLKRTEARLEEIARGHGEELGRHAAGTLSAGGKRLRPVLVFLCADGEEAEAGSGVVAAAAAVELLHMATLVHDDVLDRAPLRRGRPTVYAEGGRDAATATGDLLFSRAFAELAATESAAAVAALSAASSALARGELMQRADAWRADVPLERCLERCRLKTASLFEASCRLGALLGGRAELAAELGRFGERVGLAFQLLDDVLDVTGPAERTGKPRGADLLDGTVTLPLILARERDPGLAALDLRATAGDVERVCDRIAATGALDESTRRAHAYVEDAKAALGAMELPEATLEALALVADGAVARHA